MGHGEARIRLYGPPTADEITGGTVEWEGDEETIPHVLAVYFDKILYNLSRFRAAQDALLDRLEDVVARVGGELSERRDGQLDARIGVVPLVDKAPPEKPLALIRIEVALAYERQRATAATHFEVMKVMKTMTAETAEAGLWALWDWTLLVLDGREATIAPILDNLAVQCAYYREHGPPGVRDLGKAPFYAMMAGAGARLVEEQDAADAARLWAARPAHEFTRTAYEHIAEEERAETETVLRTAKSSDATRLDLSGAKTTDVDLARFPEMLELEALDLSGSSITDEGLFHLSGLRALDFLDLSGTSIAGQGLAYLTGTPVTRLELSRSKITDEGLTYLAGLKQLEMLWLNGTAITDAGLARLLDVPSLEELDVSDTSVTDAGLMKLLEHPKLFTAYARRTKATVDTDEAWLGGGKVLMIESEEEDAHTEVEMDQQFADYLFDETCERFQELYQPELYQRGNNPTIGRDLERALRRMMVGLGYPDTPSDAASRRIWLAGSAGYVWRLAEGRGTGFAKDRIREAVNDGFDPERARAESLTIAAAEVFGRGIPLGLESPGGLAYGGAFLDRGFRHAVESIKEPRIEIDVQHLQDAFWFGVALRDVEPIVDELRAQA